MRVRIMPSRKPFIWTPRCTCADASDYVRSLFCSGVARPKIGGAKMFDFRRITLFCLENRLSKHKMTIFSKMLGRAMAPFPPWLRLCCYVPHCLLVLLSLRCNLYMKHFQTPEYSQKVTSVTEN